MKTTNSKTLAKTIDCLTVIFGYVFNLLYFVSGLSRTMIKSQLNRKNDADNGDYNKFFQLKKV